MLDFFEVDVPQEFYSRWTQIYSATKNILMNNPAIINYWVHIRREFFYRRLLRRKIKEAEHIWDKLLKTNDDISSNDFDQVYQFIRTSVSLIITDNYCTSRYYAQTKQNADDKKNNDHHTQWAFITVR